MKRLLILVLALLLVVTFAACEKEPEIFDCGHDMRDSESGHCGGCDPGPPCGGPCGSHGACECPDCPECGLNVWWACKCEEKPPAE
jgi:hypothetical protein